MPKHRDLVTFYTPYDIKKTIIPNKLSFFISETIHKQLSLYPQCGRVVLSLEAAAKYRMRHLKASQMTTHTYD